MTPLRNKHRGEVVYVVGSGPSLNQTNLSALKGQPVVLCNSAYKLVSTLESSATYWVVVSGMRMNTFKTVDRGLFSASFRCIGAWPSWIDRGSISKEDVVLRVPVRRGFFRVMDYSPKNFSSDISDFIFHGGGSSVIFMGIQIAAYLGATKIVLVGADFGIPPGSTAHHFDSSDGLVWDAVSSSHESAYRALSSYSRQLANQNISLVNGSGWTAETVLPKVEL